MIPDWLFPTLALAPAALWVFFGVGWHWVGVLLPPTAARMTRIGATLALSPALVTVGMFLLGTFGTFNAATILLMTGVIALTGWLFARRQRYSLSLLPHTAPTPDKATLLTWVLVAVTAVALLLRFWNIAYWNFTTYDALWVYAYNAKVFFLEGRIPPTIGYYPQHIPLAYTAMQFLWGTINDHAARVVLPYIALGSVIMAYLLGTFAFNWRVGLLAAALWALYPHHAVWSQFGDLEVTVTFYMTGTAAFFIAAWREQEGRYRWRYLALAGITMGAALWTKPTAAALVQSLALIGGGAILPILANGRLRGTSRKRLPFEALAPLVTLACAVPLGGLWYVRNVLYGHPAVTLPPGYWQEAAQRSGQELGFPLLIATVFVLWRVLRPPRDRHLIALLAGYTVCAGGILLSAFGGRLPTFDELRLAAVGQIVTTITPRTFNLSDYALLILGSGLILWGALPTWRAWSPTRRGIFLLLAAFTLPYGVTWFWSYSYHYRLSFAIVPLMIVVLAAGIERIAASIPLNRVRRIALSVVIVATSLPGWYGVLSGLEPALSHTLPTDEAKIAAGNRALMGLVNFLREERQRLGRPLRVIAPGELRLNFFFPGDDIRGDVYPTHLDEIADSDIFVDSSVGQKLYFFQGTLFNQILASLTREPFMVRLYTVDDGNFRFSAYRINNAARFEPFEGRTNAAVGDVAILLQTDLSTLQQFPGENLYITNWWRAGRPADGDYSVFIHLYDAAAGRLVAAWGGQPVEGAFTVWQGVEGAHFSVPYPTRLWQAGELIKDEWKVRIPLDASPGRYELRVGLFEPTSGKRLPVEGVEDTTDYVLIHVFEVLKRP